ncbi:ComF family protein [Planococcus lenghuensis]|uniref:ComF family protein n=1 Tax=Planococcus lenghuensis TaxID=2213202 RepID=A0A1Q2L1M6_9BACL|nr:ComF family protein [Planococcus lenghuensis]AQQ53947.1 hypothetical protein B0X71_13155 [Planococcus lenghuensis]
MNCLLCDRRMAMQVSWRTMFCRDIGKVICARCEQGFSRITGPVCPVCGISSANLCPECRMWERTKYAGLISGGKSLFMYNEAMQRYLHQYKFLKDEALAAVFAPVLHDALKGRFIVPVPMNEERERERTFPQVERMLDAARLPYLQTLVKEGGIQGKKTRQERLASPLLFKWNGAEVPKRVTIADDLYTTGTTLRHAAKVLRQAGAEEILVFTLIRG